MTGAVFSFLACPTEQGRNVVATNYYFRVSTVLAAVVVAAVVVAAVVAVLVAYGNASAATSSGAIITVNTDQDESTSNDGKCSLREAITNANDNAQTSPDCPAGSMSAEDAIHFSLGNRATIGLSTALSAITDPSGLSINGQKAKITISGNDTCRCSRRAPAQSSP
jgi:CSLREA domain-containing protein